jgi:hypothetical protein
MDDLIFSLARPPARPGRPTHREEYERAVTVSRQWFDCWERTKDPRHLLVAQACQEVAHQWLKSAHKERRMSSSTVTRENDKLMPTPTRELEPAGALSDGR